MANQRHIKILQQGIDFWNKWRRDYPYIAVDLSGEEFVGADFTGADLSGSNISEADLREAHLSKANLKRAILRDTHLNDANLEEADLSDADLNCAWLNGANLRGAHLNNADLTCADLSDANLNDADLRGSNLYWSGLVRTKLNGANLTNCKIFGISAWRLELDDKTIQRDLIITQPNEPVITVDNLEVAQFIYLLLSRKKLRDIIDTVTSKTVLILGRFTPERKDILEAIANRLRQYNLIPIIFDFERATSRDFIETIKTLAGLSLFVIADITEPKSVPLELAVTIPDYQIPFVIILQEGERPFSLFKNLHNKYDWALEPLCYTSKTDLMDVFEDAVINEAFDKHKQLLSRKAEEMRTISTKDYLENAAFWNNKGKARFEQGKYEEALQAFNRAVNLDPNLADAWNGKGVVLKKIGNYKEADEAFAKAKDLGYTG